MVAEAETRTNQGIELALGTDLHHPVFKNHNRTIVDVLLHTVLEDSLALLVRNGSVGARLHESIKWPILKVAGELKQSGLAILANSVDVSALIDKVLENLLMLVVLSLSQGAADLRHSEGLLGSFNPVMEETNVNITTHEGKLVQLHRNGLRLTF
jgi:hypothetical protein